MATTSAGTTPPKSVFSGLARGVRSDLRRSFLVLLSFEAGFKLLSAAVLLPVVAALLFHLVRRGGYAAVTNTDLLAFLLSPAGVTCAFLMGLKVLALTL